jgi:hypothetical protein
MKLIIAGSRHLHPAASIIDKHVTDLEEATGRQVTRVLCGMAPGVDTAGRKWAIAFDYPVDRHPALWSVHGNAAGPIRNRQMAEHADALLLIWDGESPGSRDMLRAANDRGLIVREVRL